MTHSPPSRWRAALLRALLMRRLITRAEYDALLS